MFQNARYLTKGIDDKISVSLQLIIWQLIEEARGNTDLDYLQIFTLNKEPSGLIHIVHEQEQPKYKHQSYVFCDSAIEGIVKIYVIDDGDHCTMLLAEEY